MKNLILYTAAAVGRAGFEQLIARKFSKHDRKQIMRAYRLSKHGHQKQSRRDGSRYFEHPKAVAVMLLLLGVTDADVICAALLHDIIEDTFILSFGDIKAWFGKRVRRFVKLVTKLKTVSKEEYFACLAASNSPGAWLVKLADRTHNLSTLIDSNDPIKQVECRRKKLEQVEETRQYILPLAMALKQCPSHKSLSKWFGTQLTAWCNRREQEAT